MNAWFKYFFQPKRLKWTLIGIGLVIVIINPGLLAFACTRLMSELAPAVAPLLVLAIMWLMLKSAFK